MDRFKWLRAAIVILTFLCAFSTARELKFKRNGHVHSYNHTLATTLVEYASAVYISDLTELFTWTCPRCGDLTKGFEMIELIVDVENCLQAYVGVAMDLNTIIIAFRGTQENSLQNWIEDLYWKQLDLNYPGMPDSMVHHGFYSAYHNTTIRPCILNAVKTAKELYGELDIMVTGHSMGGAMAGFCGLDLVVNHEAPNVLVMTFGQPRIGNAAFASYYSQMVPNTFRITNDHDMVPHLPPYYHYFPQKTYHHFPREQPHHTQWSSPCHPSLCSWIYPNPTRSRRKIFSRIFGLICRTVSMTHVNSLFPQHYNYNHADSHATVVVTFSTCSIQGSRG